MRVKRVEYGAAPECKAGGNGRSPREPANQRHRPSRFPRAKIWALSSRNRTRFALVGREQLCLSTAFDTSEHASCKDDCCSLTTRLIASTCKTLTFWGRGGLVASLLASHQRKPGSVPCGVGFPRGSPPPPPDTAPYSPRFTLIGSRDVDVKCHQYLYGPLHGLDYSSLTKANWVRLLVGIVLEDAAGRRIFSGVSCFPRPCIPAPLHTHLASPSSALKDLTVKSCAKCSSPLLFGAFSGINVFIHIKNYSTVGTVMIDKVWYVLFADGRELGTNIPVNYMKEEATIHYSVTFDQLKINGGAETHFDSLNARSDATQQAASSRGGPLAVEAGR
ncbi:hypothetical protein PR048_018817 [Dryococelus australis]|uniref:Uncharacterized protein n=1 Tax=Dryococelus australis TaxID=614101 RepID=A0ABQ9H1U0_9NEOP|nr:hypothetical protein PR048_018817 [Dryococelus australis]